MKKGAGLILLILVVALVVYRSRACQEAIDVTDTYYNEALPQSLARGAEAKLKADLRHLRRNIQHFHSAHGRYPNSLDELVEKGIMGHIPKDPSGEGWDYDSSTGWVTSRKFPDL